MRYYTHHAPDNPFQSRRIEEDFIFTPGNFHFNFFKHLIDYENKDYEFETPFSGYKM